MVQNELPDEASKRKVRQSLTRGWNSGRASRCTSTFCSGWQGLTLVHVRARFEQLQDTFMS
jgi:hypothetical protein